MRVIKIDLPKDFKSVEIHTLADLHIGDKYCDMESIKSKINYIRDTPNAVCILNGDLLNNATKSSVSDVYAEEMTPMEEAELCIELLEPIKEKIIAITAGNHENRTLKNDGVDLTKFIAKQFGILDRYSPTSCFIFLRVGESRLHAKDRKISYMLFCLHGSGGGRKEGAKAIRLADMASIIDADVYIHSHLHLPMVMKQGFYRTSPANSSVAKVDKLFVCTAASLDYGGYGEAYEFKPSSKESPVIRLSGVKKFFDATL